MIVLLDLVPIVLIPAMLVVHWWTPFKRWRDTGELPRRGSADFFRMTDVERVVVFIGTVGVFAYVVARFAAGSHPHPIVTAAAVLFATLLFMDFWVNLRHPEDRPPGKNRG